MSSRLAVVNDRLDIRVVAVDRFLSGVHGLHRADFRKFEQFEQFQPCSILRIVNMLARKAFRADHHGAMP
jgi:hypothetical protein